KDVFAIKNKVLSPIFFIAILMTITITLINKQTAPVITYFPYADDINFSNHSTHLYTTDKKDETHLNWRIYSQTAKPLYLRQDVGLLFRNSKLVGILNKWQQNSEVVEQKSKIKKQPDSTYQAISFHFGEIHLNEDINSTF